MDTAPDNRSPSGGTLSHYRLIERLGEGAMGVVWRARDEKLQRDVALKLLRPGEVAGAEARAALVREAQNASRLNHPHICTVHEVDQDGGQVFIAMELVEGRPLKDVIPRGGMPDETVARYAAPLARALAHAHGRGVIHRDIKSRNIVIGPDGEAKLLDFGLSRGTPADADASTTVGLSSAGLVVGTPQYLAPEVLEGGRASVASDLWAFGVVLHEMCSGAPPFAADSMAGMVAAILHGAPAPLPDHTGPGMRAVIARCLTKDPRQRYHRAEEIAAALEALLTGTLGVPRPRRRVRRRTWLAAGLGALVLLAAAALALNLGGVRTQLFGGRIESIAVLPLETRPPDPAQEYFADGMTEQLIADLASIQGLRVISRTSIMRYKGGHPSLAEIALTLGVDAVLEGSVTRDSGQVRIQLRLVDPHTERQLWAGHFDRPLRDVLGLQSEVAAEVSDRIRAHLSGAERARLAAAQPVDAVAVDHYLRGRYALSHEQPARAIGEFREALRIEPGYASAWAGLAHSYVKAHAMGDSSLEAAQPRALAAARRAVTIDPNSAEAHLAMANAQATLSWNLGEAEQSARRALELSPGDAEAHHTYGLIAGVQGRMDECVAELQRARELDPLASYYHVQLGEVLLYDRRYDRAVAELQETVEMFPEDTAGRRDLAWARMLAGDTTRAIAELEAMRPLAAPLGCAYAGRGRVADARRVLDDIAARAEQGRASAVEAAEVAAALGDRDAAFRWLALAWERREQSFFTLPYDPALDPLRSDPRYAALVARLPGAPGAARPNP